MKKTITITMLFMLTVSLITQAAAYKTPLRLHIVANSDNAADQSVKLMVRDGILEIADEIFEGTLTPKEAVKKAEEYRELFEAKANEILEENGLNYGAKAETGIFTFPEKEYGKLIYPAGEYNALRVVLGKGGGHNWWCVMYPSLCTGGSVYSNKKQIKSAIFEWLKGMRRTLANK